jgi:anti-anti-sigma factor
MPGDCSQPPPYFSASLQAVEAEVVITACGELDAASGSTLTDVIVQAVSTPCRRVIVDASAVTFLDAAGLHVLCGRTLGRGAEVPIMLRAPSRPVKRLLELTDLCGLIETTSGPPPGGERVA